MVMFLCVLFSALSLSPCLSLPLSDALSMLMDTAHSAIFQGMIEVQKKLFMAKQTGFELLRLVLTNGEGALSTVRNGNVNPLKNSKKKKTDYLVRP